jgi:hypothetical protein
MGVATDGTYATYGDLWVISVSHESHPFLPPHAYIMVFLVNL